MIYTNLHRGLLVATLFLFLGNMTTGLSAQKLEGIASFYADRFDGKKTSTGEVFRQSGYSAASKELPWGTIVEVTNLSNGKTTQVRVNDCGPHAKDRIIDLSRAAANDLGFVKAGEAKVRLRVLKTSDAGPNCSRGAWAKKLKAQGKAVPPPPPPWDPTQTVSMTPVNPVVPGPPSVDPAIPVPEGTLRGKASYYGDRFNGRPTSTGETYDHRLRTAASKDFPYGTILEVTNIVSGQKVEVKVNDCGPNSPDRIIDLSRAAAAQIGVIQAGIAVVQLRVVSLGVDGPTCNRSAWSQERTAARDNAAVLSPRSPQPAGEQPENMVDAYTVQVGAFKNAANSDELINDMISKGVDASDFYPRKESDDLHRTSIGVFSSEAAAKDMEKEIHKKGYTKASVKKIRVPAEDLRDPVVTYGTTVVTPPTQAAPPKQQFDPTDILFGVQVGAFSTKANADKSLKGLREKGFSDAYSARVGEMYRVFSGKFYFQSQAEVLKEKLREAGYEQATVRRVQ
ncbi:septal ring lytic transglycosylase RlpA family protein [Neolewinella persica]|uniref:septal ring lytic transglycosylase RlpA family protein n=1 Tax=Neolewinella persica TaxID=70998 RepID=UPI00039EBBFD|nr:septal ring lytic transglycosylase RlpA family protein [Neolewinella persica]